MLGMEELSQGSAAMALGMSLLLIPSHCILYTGIHLAPTGPLVPQVSVPAGAWGSHQDPLITSIIFIRITAHTGVSWPTLVSPIVFLGT